MKPEYYEGPKAGDNFEQLGKGCFSGTENGSPEETA